MGGLGIAGAPVELVQPAERRADLADARRAAALDALRTAPEIVGVTLRRELGGRWWDITLTSRYWERQDAAGEREPRTLYHWDAEATDLGEAVSPPPWHGPGSFESPAAALAAATATLERAGEGPVIASLGPRR